MATCTSTFWGGGVWDGGCGWPVSYWYPYRVRGGGVGMGSVVLNIYWIPPSCLCLHVNAIHACVCIWRTGCNITTATVQRHTISHLSLRLTVGYDMVPFWTTSTRLPTPRWWGRDRALHREASSGPHVHAMNPAVRSGTSAQRRTRLQRVELRLRLFVLATERVLGSFLCAWTFFFPLL